METGSLDDERSAQLDKFFDSRKFYIRVALIVFGIIAVVLFFRKMKMQYTS